MNIGIDLDNTLIETNIVDDVTKDLNVNYTSFDIRDWEFSNFPKELREEIFKRFVNPYYMCYHNINPVRNASKKLEEWQRKKHNLYLITARADEVKVDTIKMVKKYFKVFNSGNIFFTGLGGDKRHYFKKLNLDVWIDDHPNNCMESAKLNIKTYLISNQNTPYNKSINLKNIIKVKSINDINL